MAQVDLFFDIIDGNVEEIQNKLNIHNNFKLVSDDPGLEDVTLLQTAVSQYYVLPPLGKGPFDIINLLLDASREGKINLLLNHVDATGSTVFNDISTMISYVENKINETGENPEQGISEEVLEQLYELDDTLVDMRNELNNIPDAAPAAGGGRKHHKKSQKKHHKKSHKTKKSHKKSQKKHHKKTHKKSYKTKKSKIHHKKSHKK